jgi:signal transduction histidine kinase
VSEEERPFEPDEVRGAQGALSRANAAREQAEKTNREIAEFLELLSHELRGPLAAIRLQLELLARAQTDFPDRKQSGVVDRLARSSSRLAEIVDSILPLAGLESGRVVPQLAELDLNAIAAQTIEQFRERAAARALTIRLDSANAGAPIASDPELVELIIAKLCDNAINHASAGEIVVAIDRGDSARVVRLRVGDEGPGIPAAERAQASSLLAQYEKAHARTGGEVCFALSLVKRVAAALGAEVAVENLAGFGRRVSVSFPASPPA